MSDEDIFNFIRIYLLSEPAENNYEKSDFCLMVGFYLTEFVAWVFIYKNKETMSVVG